MLEESGTLCVAAMTCSADDSTNGSRVDYSMEDDDDDDDVLPAGQKHVRSGN